MKEAHKKFLKVFAAIIPAGLLCGSFPQTFWTASLLGAGMLLVTHLFILLKPLFPQTLFRTAVILFLAVMFQIFQEIFHPLPFWIVSLALLLDWNDYDPKHIGQRPLPPLVRAAIFFGGILFIGLVREFLGKQLGIQSFQHPAGIFISLAFFSAAVLSIEKPLAPLWLKKRRGV